MAAPPGRTAEEQQRLDRQLGELLQELRVVMPGVQVLFAFLLAVPFADGFGRVSALEKDVYLFTLLTAATSAALLTAPAAYHRVLFGRGKKDRVIAVATRGVLVGLVFLALSMCSAILLVTSYLFSTVTAVVCAGAAVLLFGTLWFGVGWAGRR